MDLPTALPQPDLPEIGIVGAGRVGRAIARALGAAGCVVSGPTVRGEQPRGGAILLCVPDAEIAAAAASLSGTARLVGHTSGATPLGAMSAAADAGAELFGLHPLQTFSAEGGGFAGSACAIAGSSSRAIAVARALAHALGMTPFVIEDDQRSAYHAAASIASNFLITLEASAEVVAAQAGIAAEDARAALRPLVEGAVHNWATLGPEAALTGPVARGDTRTVAAQRAAVRAADAQLLPLFDALVERTVALASHAPGEGAQAAPSQGRVA